MRAPSHRIHNRVCMQCDLLAILLRRHKIFSDLCDLGVHFILSAILIDKVVDSSTVKAGCLRHQRTFHLHDRCFMSVINIVAGCLASNQAAAQHDDALSEVCKICGVHIHRRDCILNAFDRQDQII